MTREQRKVALEEADKVAVQIWESMTPGERHGVRFGLFPASRMNVPGVDQCLLSCALMSIAEANGGMRA